MKPILIAALCAATVAHAQTTWKGANGYRSESLHTENIVAVNTKSFDALTPLVRSVGSAASDIFVPYYFN
jgi:hypothetical protein